MRAVGIDAGTMVPERRVALIHRVIVPDVKSPREYAVLITKKQSIFIRQEKTRSNFVLRREMRYGTALVTDVVPSTLEDYERTSLETLATDAVNLAIPHQAVSSLVMKKEVPTFRHRDIFVWLTMKRQQEIFQVYHFEMTWLRAPDQQARIRFYMVPLGAYFKPRREFQTRETILHEYANDGLQIFQSVLPPGIVLSLV